MAESKTQGKTQVGDVYIVNYICDECGIGTMQPENYILPAHPPMYPHVCSNCGHKETFSNMYPKLEYEERKEQ